MRRFYFFGQNAALLQKIDRQQHKDNDADGNAYGPEGGGFSDTQGKIDLIGFAFVFKLGPDDVVAGIAKFEALPEYVSDASGNSLPR